jgi:hypothetical protein
VGKNKNDHEINSKAGKMTATDKLGYSETFLFSYI